MPERDIKMAAKVVELSMKKDDKLKALEAAIGQIEKNFGKGSVMKASKGVAFGEVRHFAASP